METLTKIWTLINSGIATYMYQYEISTILLVIVIGGALLNVLLILLRVQYLTNRIHHDNTKPF